MVIAVTPFGATDGHAQPPIVQPGAPGEPSRRISAEEASDLAGIRFTDADVKFMQGMISHHAQALEMTDLLATRSERDVMHRLAQRIALSQDDEITMMHEWLRARDLAVPDRDAHHAPDAELMPGMLTDEQLTQLEQAPALEFDRLFLAFMIEHHRGALTMVENLLEQRGAAQDSQRFCQLDRSKTFFSLIERPPSHCQQAHVTTSHSTNARVRSKRWCTDRSRCRPTRKRFCTTPCTDAKRCRWPADLKRRIWRSRCRVG